MSIRHGRAPPTQLVEVVRTIAVRAKIRTDRARRTAHERRRPLVFDDLSRDVAEGQTQRRAEFPLQLVEVLELVHTSDPFSFVNARARPSHTTARRGELFGVHGRDGDSAFGP